MVQEPLRDARGGRDLVDRDGVVRARVEEPAPEIEQLGAPLVDGEAGARVAIAWRADRSGVLTIVQWCGLGSRARAAVGGRPRIDTMRSASVWSPRPHGDLTRVTTTTRSHSRIAAGSKGVVRCPSSRRFASPPSCRSPSVSTLVAPRVASADVATGRHHHQGQSGQDQRARRRRRAVVREPRDGDEDRPVPEDPAAEALPGGDREVLGAGEAEGRPDARGLRRRPAVPAGRPRRSDGGDQADVQLRAHALLHRRPRAPSLRRRHRPAAGRSGRPPALQRRAPLRARLAARAPVHRPPPHRSRSPRSSPTRTARSARPASIRCSSRST